MVAAETTVPPGCVGSKKYASGIKFLASKYGIPVQFVDVYQRSMSEKLLRTNPKRYMARCKKNHCLGTICRITVLKLGIEGAGVSATRLPNTMPWASTTSVGAGVTIDEAAITGEASSTKDKIKAFFLKALLLFH
jgi:hypothetical protein